MSKRWVHCARTAQCYHVFICLVSNVAYQLSELNHYRSVHTVVCTLSRAIKVYHDVDIYECVPIYTHVLLCTPINHHILPCIPMYCHEYPHIAMYTHVSTYIATYAYVLPCTPMYFHVQLGKAIKSHDRRETYE